MSRRSRRLEPREVAEKAIKEIKNVPPAADGLFHRRRGRRDSDHRSSFGDCDVNSLNNDGDSPRPTAAESTTTEQPAASQPAARPSLYAANRPQTAQRLKPSPTAPWLKPSQRQLAAQPKARTRRKKPAASAAPLSSPRTDGRSTPFPRERKCRSMEKPILHG